MTETNYWRSHKNTEYVDVIALIPQSHMLSFRVPPTTTINQLKEMASKKIIDDKSTNISKFHILYINQDNFPEEVVNHELMLKQLNFFLPVFRFVYEDNLLSSKDKIERLLSRFNLETENIPNYGCHIEAQRYELNEFCYSQHLNIKNYSHKKRFIINYPQKIRKVDSMDMDMQSKFVNINSMKISLNFKKTEDNIVTIDIQCSVVITVKQLKAIAQLKLNEVGIKMDPSVCVIKLLGRSIYFMGELNDEMNTFDENIRLVDYLEIQKLLFEKETIVLLITIPPFNSADKYELVTRISNQSHSSENRKKMEPVNVWDLEDSKKFEIRFTKVEIPKDITYYMLKVGLFSGEKLLDSVLETSIYPSSCESIKESKIFETPLNSLPVDTKVCITLLGFKTKTSTTPKAKHLLPIAWVNVNMYDYLLTSSQKVKNLLMSVSPILKEVESLYPLGTTLPIPNIKSAIKIQFNFLYEDGTIRYPSDIEIGNLSRATFGEKSQSKKVYKEYFKDMAEWSSTSEMKDEEKTKIWAECDSCLTFFPTMLPKVMQAMPNYSKKSILKMYQILKNCALLKQELCLELLDIKYINPLFRSFTAKNLETLNDSQLELYMPQLVEGLRFERHIMNQLSLFMLRRSMNNRRIAHYFIWSLLADYENDENKVRNGLLVEAYCRVNPEHFHDLDKQIEMMNKLKNFYQIATINNIVLRDDLQDLLKKYLNNPEVKKVLENVTSPLDPSVLLKDIKINNCEVMESKKKPLLLVFESVDDPSIVIKILYKFGDDLRQDILVLQSFKIVSNICEKLDTSIKFTCYDVISVGKIEGMISFVQDSITLAKIQASKGFKAHVLHEWYIEVLQSEGKYTDENISNGCKRFSTSCAGYSVMTYLLGIGDRHNDNIMLHKSGRLFHIDFGHILGNFKSFYGIKRERVPFIMTKDFLYFASDAKITSESISKYREYCSELFIFIRESSYLILIPLLLMINSNLPELTSESDLHYILWALDFSLDTQSAKSKFEQKFMEAYDNSWSTELNFKAHNLKIASLNNGKKESRASISTIKF